MPDFIANPDPDRYLSDNYIVLDFETEVMDGRYGSAIDPRNSLLLACWSDSSGRSSVSWGSEYSQQGLVDALSRCDFMVAHNAKYELGWLRRCGADIGNLLVYDTKIGEYVLLGNLASGDADYGLRPVSTSLDDCCRRRGWHPKDPIVDLWLKNGIRVSQMPQKWVEDRCKLDVESTRRLFIDQRDRLVSTNRLGVVYTRCILTPCLADIEQEGMHLDRDRVYASHAAFSGELRNLESKLEADTGGINWRSSNQVAAYLYDTLGFEEPKKRSGEPKRSSTGRRLANKRVLASLRAHTDPQRDFLALRRDIGKVGSALSKNLDYFKEICDVRDGTFHAEFNQTVTATHRLSSTGIKEVSGKSVQFQNLPRDFKPLFTAKRAGWLIGEADGSQLEFRVAAYLGNDAQARRDIADTGWDAHLVTAAAMHNADYHDLQKRLADGDKVVAKWRQEAKAETFKPLYGGSKGTPAQERWYAEFKRRYKDLAKVQQDWVYEVLSSKRLVTPWGLRYYFPHARMSDSGYVNVGASVYNYPVQALATAEIVPIAVSYFWHRIRAEGLGDFIIPINTVHDSLVCEIHPDYVERFKSLAIQAFGRDVYNYLRTVYSMDFNVPLGCGIKVSKYWGEGEEETWNTLPDGKQERVK